MAENSSSPSDPRGDDASQAAFDATLRAWLGPTLEASKERVKGWAAELRVMASDLDPSRDVPANRETTMNLDPRVLFYMDHKDQIDEWCRIRAEVTLAAHRYLCDLAEPARVLAGRLEPAPCVHVETDCEYPKILFYLPSWRGPSTVPSRVAIGLEWVRHSANFETAYSGVWVDCRHPEGSVLSARLEAVICEMSAAAGYVRRNQWFPAQRIEQPIEPQYWRNLRGFRDQILASLEHSWKVFQPVVSHITA